MAIPDSIKKLTEWADCEALELTPFQQQQFAEFEADLYLYNRHVNVTRVPKEDCWIRHFADSLLFQDLIPTDSTLLDIGTGPGFPAWPIACARPDLQVTALDSNEKMLRFLRDHTLSNLRVVKARAEEFKAEHPFIAVTGRALAPLPIQLELSAPLCASNGFVIPMRMPSEYFELAQLPFLGLKLVEVVVRCLPESDAARACPVYQKVSPTSKRLPRRWAEMKSSPLS